MIYCSYGENDRVILVWRVSTTCMASTRLIRLDPQSQPQLLEPSRVSLLQWNSRILAGVWIFGVCRYSAILSHRFSLPVLTPVIPNVNYLLHNLQSGLQHKSGTNIFTELKILPHFTAVLEIWAQLDAALLTPVSTRQCLCICVDMTYIVTPMKIVFWYLITRASMIRW